MSKASNAFGKFMVWLFVVVLIVAVVGVAVFLGLREQGMTYFVEYNGQRYWGGRGEGSLFIWTSETHKFSVKSLTGGNVEFSAKITSSADSNIRYSYNDELHYSYTGNADIDDYSDIFGLQTGADGFTMTIPQDMTVETAIEAKCGGDITLIGELSEETAYFVITVTVDKHSVLLPFTFGKRVTGVTIDPPQIIL